MSNFSIRDILQYNIHHISKPFQITKYNNFNLIIHQDKIISSKFQSLSNSFSYSSNSFSRALSNSINFDQTRKWTTTHLFISIPSISSISISLMNITTSFFAFHNFHSQLTFPYFIQLLSTRQMMEKIQTNKYPTKL
jgi:hypothetical protein